MKKHEIDAAVATARKLPPPTRPLAEIVAEFRHIAREHGYAIGEHGTQKRDYDLIACPWVKEAKAASTLVRALNEVEGVHLRFHTKSRSINYEMSRPKKPHGRLGCVFLIEPFHYRRQPGYIDLSIMPRSAA